MYIKAEWKPEYLGFLNTLPCGYQHLTDSIPETWRVNWWKVDHKNCCGRV